MWCFVVLEATYALVEDRNRTFGDNSAGKTVSETNSRISAGVSKVQELVPLSVNKKNTFTTKKLSNLGL